MGTGGRNRPRNLKPSLHCSASPRSAPITPLTAASSSANANIDSAEGRLNTVIRPEKVFSARKRTGVLIAADNTTRRGSPSHHCPASAATATFHQNESISPTSLALIRRTAKISRLPPTNVKAAAVALISVPRGGASGDPGVRKSTTASVTQ